VNEWRRVRIAVTALVAVVLAGWIGYQALGLGSLDALYQTVTTITTVGFREVVPFGTSEKWFTMVLVVVGVGTALYTLGTVLEAVLEGRLRDLYGRRRMERAISKMSDHVVVCGWGRVGRSLTEIVAGAGQTVVVVDRDEERLTGVSHPVVLGDATDDAVLHRAGVGRARALVSALDSDAANLFVTVSARAISPRLFIVARARGDRNDEKLLRAGADRVVNPQAIGGARMAAFVLQPNVAEFLDLVMHDGSLEFRLEEVTVPVGSPLIGHSVRDAHVRDRTGALVLALRHPDGSFTTNPAPETPIAGGQVLIAIGTADQLAALERLLIV
jgi:voltage-gated potassium channel